MEKNKIELNLATFLSVPQNNKAKFIIARNGSSYTKHTRPNSLHKRPFEGDRSLFRRKISPILPPRPPTHPSIPPCGGPWKGPLQKSPSSGIGDGGICLRFSLPSCWQGEIPSAREKGWLPVGMTQGPRVRSRGKDTHRSWVGSPWGFENHTSPVKKFNFYFERNPFRRPLSLGIWDAGT